MTPLLGKTVLLVEDDALAGIDCREQLLLAGAEVIGPVASISDAMACLSRHEIDVAVLDHALLDGNSLDLQTALDNKDVPYVILTGYPSVLVRRGEDQAILQKPVRSELLWDTVRSACSQRGGTEREV